MVLIALAAALGVGVLLDGVFGHDDLSSYDVSISQALVTARTPGWADAAQVVTTAGGVIAMPILSALAIVWLLVVRRDRRAALLLTTSMLTVAGLVLGLKALVGRPRPPVWMVSGPPEVTSSFPSGHTLASTVFLGVTAGLVARRTPGRARVALLAVWFIVCAGVGFRRIYLGYHLMTDVLAGWLLGVVVLALGTMAMLGSSPRRPALAGDPVGDMNDRGSR